MAQIVVGIDGSPGAAGALRFAVAEAGFRHAAVTAVMAWGYLDQHHADGSKEFDPAYDEEQAQAAAYAAVVAAGVDQSSVTVTPAAVNDLPAPALLSAAAGADLLVVGARGLGGFKGLLLGSVSDRCLSRSSCPVAVIPPTAAEHEPDRHGRIVVGVDGSPGSHAALRWAVEEGKARGAHVLALHSWTMPFLGGEALATGGIQSDQLQAGARTVLDEALQSVAAAGLPAPETAAVFSSAAPALLEAAQQADLVVLGGNPPEGLDRVLLGSTARQVIHHTPCPAVVVPS